MLAFDVRNERRTSSPFLDSQQAYDACMAKYVAGTPLKLTRVNEAYRVPK